MDPLVNPSKASVVASELRKQLENEIRMEIEYFMTPNGLQENPKLQESLKKSTTSSVPLEELLNIERLKQLGVTKMDILNAMADSEKLEINGDGTGIKRKPLRSLQEFEPNVQKKVKTEKGGAPAVKSTTTKEGIEPKLFKITFEDIPKGLKESKLRSEIEKRLNIDVLSITLNGKEGFFTVDSSKLTEEDKKKTASGAIELAGKIAKIQECWDDDLDVFMKKNGKQLNHYLERSGIRHKHAGAKDEVDLVFYCNKYHDVAPLEYIFHGILSKTKDREEVNSADAALLKEFCKYLDDPDSVEGASSFIAGFHPKDPAKKCFFALLPDNKKIPFSFDDLSENLIEKFIEPNLDLQKQNFEKGLRA